jgi:hypothetical protein
MGIASWLGLRPRPNKQPKRRVKPKSDTYPPLPAQDEGEFQRFLDLIRAEKVQSYLEIGARHGGSFNAVMRSLPPGSVGIAVDLPGVSWGRGDSEIVLRRVILDLYRDGYRAKLVVGSSQDPAIIEAVAQHAPFGSIFIDGDHSYEGVRSDWINYGKLARIVALHDIAGDNVVTKRTPIPVEVPRLWREISSEGLGMVHELVTDPRHWGIGVIVRSSTTMQ